ncbi:DUF4097 family beta strand repeat-containing protein [Dictyobacter formicarum]|uniref:DUF4097 domain-containing protein n=1 Tax=Dictyobacter formicarum TaxID=2778368 RepID=A0ABQ3VV92_9CHLR|nr:DUF4097 family beta strand repeat-containing protein [Dictyobacter formicarum]GHO89599.1 hypothetical protein KSZ_76050 [Dictyobacter formicarum]
MGKQQSSFGDSQEPQRPFNGYADPTSPIHEDPYEQAQRERDGAPVPLYLEGYRGPIEDFSRRGFIGEKLIPPPGPSPLVKAMKFIPPALILLLLLFMLAGGGNFFKQMVQAKNTITQQLATDQPYRVVVHDAQGRVHIHGSNSGPVTVTSTRYNASWVPQASDMNVDARVVDDGQTILINAEKRGDSSRNDGQSVDLDVTVPSFINVQITADHGAVKIDGITGSMNVYASDSINAQNIHSGHGRIAFRSRDGAIDVDQIDGQVSFSTYQGHIEVDGAHLTGSSRMRTQDGKIVFDGSVDPENDYSFETRSGAVAVSLPSNSSFILRIFSDHSPVDNEFGSTVIGPGPRAHIGIATMSGNVEINEDN